MPETLHGVTTLLADDISRFYDWLSVHAHGRANAKTAKQLAKMGCQSTDRELRLLRHGALMYGLLVCADNAGYFVPRSPDEVQESSGRLRSQGLDMIRQADAMDKLARERFDPQPSLLSA